jgi:hypothetical protein
MWHLLNSKIPCGNPVFYNTYFTILQADFGNQLIRFIDFSTRTITTLAGRQGITSPFSDGVGTVATFAAPACIALNGAGTVALLVRRSLVRSDLTTLIHRTDVVFYLFAGRWR